MRRAAKATNPPSRVTNREHDSSPESIIGSPRIAARHQPRRDHLVRFRVQPGLQVVPSRRRIADAEPRRDPAIESALFQIVDGLGMFAQRLAIQLRRLLEQRIQARIDLLDPRAAFSWNLDVGDGRQSLDGLDETPIRRAPSAKVIAVRAGANSRNTCNHPVPD